MILSRGVPGVVSRQTRLSRSEPGIRYQGRSKDFSDAFSERGITQQGQHMEEGHHWMTKTHISYKVLNLELRQKQH